MRFKSRGYAEQTCEQNTCNTSNRLHVVVLRALSSIARARTVYACAVVPRTDTKKCGKANHDCCGANANDRKEQNRVLSFTNNTTVTCSETFPTWTRWCFAIAPLSTSHRVHLESEWVSEWVRGDRARIRKRLIVCMFGPTGCENSELIWRTSMRSQPNCDRRFLDGDKTGASCGTTPKSRRSCGPKSRRSCGKCMGRGHPCRRHWINSMHRICNEIDKYIIEMNMNSNVRQLSANAWLLWSISNDRIVSVRSASADFLTLFLSSRMLIVWTVRVNSGTRIQPVDDQI